VLIIAVCIGVVEYIPVFCLAWSISRKYGLYDSILSNSCLLNMTLVNIGLSNALVITSVLLTRLVPIAGGSGIPPIIAYLCNGKKKERSLFAPKLVVVKMLSVVLAISGGLAIGREGPAIHVGAAIANVVNNLEKRVMRWYTGERIKFDGAVKSNVVMMGATAGFASAFNSSIGGMLYCVEEIAVHWDIKSHMAVGAQTFVVASVSAFVTQTIITITSGGFIKYSSIVIFEDDDHLNQGSAYHFHDIPSFFVVAILCGILAGVCSKASNVITVWRSKDKARQRLLIVIRDTVLITTLSSLVFSLLPMLYTNCRDISVQGDDGDGGHRLLSSGGGDRKYVQYNCPEGQYSPLASMSLAGKQ
jgi:chloride channel 7